MASRPNELDLPPADDIKIKDNGPVMRAAGNVIELVPMNFGFPPSGRRGPVFNFRSEGRQFDKSNRCIIPASAFFEFTGKKYPKAKHRLTLNGASFLAIAGLWRDGNAGARPAFTMLTTSPGRDVEAYHSRQIVVLRPEHWAAWIYLTKPETEPLRPLPRLARCGNRSRRERLKTSTDSGTNGEAERKIGLTRERSASDFGSSDTIAL